jgi:hypothetical protein
LRGEESGASNGTGSLADGVEPGATVTTVAIVVED